MSISIAKCRTSDNSVCYQVQFWKQDGEELCRPRRLLSTSDDNILRDLKHSSPEGGGGNPLYKPYRNVPSQRVWFLGLFGLKTGIHITHFGLESGMVFEGTTGAYEYNYRFNSKLIRKIEICEFEMHLRKFLLAL